MPVTERVMALGDWSVRLKPDTPFSVRNSISTPFSQIVITPGRLPSVSLTDTIALGQALYCGVVLRPGPQFELAGCGLLWFLQGGDQSFGNGFASSLSYSAGTLSSAVSTVLSGTSFSSGTVSAATVAAFSGADVLRGNVLYKLASESGFEYRIKPDRSIDVGTPATIYGSSPTAVVVAERGPKEVATPYGLTGSVASTWDYEGYASSAVVWTQNERVTAGGASTYRDPGGTLMTIYRGWEFNDAPYGAASGIATQLVSTVNRAVRTVEVTSDEFAVTGTVKCGGSVWLYDVDNGLVDRSQQLVWAGRVITPISARVMSVTYPVLPGMGVYVRSHNGTSASYVDITDHVEFETGEARFEVSTAAQWLAPQRSTTLQDLWSPWQPYDCEWRATVTNPTLGNGTLTASFRRLGTSVDVQITLVIGTTSAGGAGAWAFILPPNVAPKTITGGYATGKAMLLNAGVAAYDGGCYVASADTTLYITDGNSPWANVTADAGGVPFAWGAGDSINVNITFECAP